MYIDMGDEGRYSATDIGTFTFRRDSNSPIKLKDVMYVSGLKKNLVLAAMLEDCGCDVIFKKQKAFLRHISMGQVKWIMVHVNNLYKLDVEDYTILSKNAEKM